MRCQTPVKNQFNFLGNTLGELLNPKHELYLLSNAIIWDYFEQEFKELNSKNGRPALLKPCLMDNTLLYLLGCAE
jgi:hypothetical protein